MRAIFVEFARPCLTLLCACDGLLFLYQVRFLQNLVGHYKCIPEGYDDPPPQEALSELASATVEEHASAVPSRVVLLCLCESCFISEN